MRQNSIFASNDVPDSALKLSQQLHWNRHVNLIASQISTLDDWLSRQHALETNCILPILTTLWAMHFVTRRQADDSYTRHDVESRLQKIIAASTDPLIQFPVHYILSSFYRSNAVTNEAHFAAAKEHATKAIAIAEQLQDHLLLGHANNQLALLLRLKSAHLSDAERILRATMDNSHHIDTQTLSATSRFILHTEGSLINRTRMNLAQVLLKQHNAQDAIQDLRALYHASKQNHTESLTHAYIAMILIEAENQLLQQSASQQQESPNYDSLIRDAYITFTLCIDRDQPDPNLIRLYIASAELLQILDDQRSGNFMRCAEGLLAKTQGQTELLARLDALQAKSTAGLQP